MDTLNTDDTRSTSHAARQEHNRSRHAQANDAHGHVPVMLGRIAELLAPALGEGEQSGVDAIATPSAASPLDSSPRVLIDLTLGAGGHTEHLLKTFPTCAVIGVDRDLHSLTKATERLAPFGERFVPLHTRFDGCVATINAAASDHDAHPVLAYAARNGVSGVLGDLGVSSMQLDQAERGFAYRNDAPLDMRMDDSQELTAATILNTYEQADLVRILKQYGEERFAQKIARAIVATRDATPFTHSSQLVELLYDVIPAAARRAGGHPAKRTFQALRIEVNGELDALSAVIPAVASVLQIGGRLVFMSYQSLEDKIVKRAFTDMCATKTPPGLPMDLPGSEPSYALITRGAEQASDEERDINPRAASVRVRAVEKIRDER